MTPKNPVEPEGDDSLGVLDDTPSSDTTGIGLHGGTAQVNVALPTGADDDDLIDDEIVDGELEPAEIVSDLILDTSAVADPDTVTRIDQEAPAIVIELPAEQLATQPREVDDEADSGSVQTIDQDEEITRDEAVSAEAAAETAEIVVENEDVVSEGDAARNTGDEVLESEDPQTEDLESEDPQAEDLDTDTLTAATPEVEAREPEIPAPENLEPEDLETEELESEHPQTEEFDPASVDAEKPTAMESDAAEPVAKAPDIGASEEPDTDTVRLAHLESVVAAAKAQLRDAMAPTTSDEMSEKQSEARPQSIEPEEEISPVANDDRAPVARPAAGSTRPYSEPPGANAEVALTSKRLDDLGASQRESADLLTADRLLEPSRVAKPEPEGTWSHLLYAISGGRINVGDSRKARERKELNARIAAPMAGAARFVPVLSRKGGVGKTTVTALLGMALADARDDRVIAVDANPDRGTLAERVVGAHSKSVRDMVRAQHDIRGFHDISALVARDETRLDVLASDADPRVSEAFGDADYREVATIAAQYYSLVLTDSGTGIVHSVMGATLDLADQIVIVSGLSVDEARLASETLTWLETNGYAELAREAIVVLNQSTPGAPMVRLGELESHFSTRAKHVLRVPYDPQIAGGGAIDFASLQPATRQAARMIAASLIERLRAKAA